MVPMVWPMTRILGQGRYIKFFTKGELILANIHAMQTNRNRQLDTSKLEALPDDIRLPVVFSMIHNDVEIRVAIAMNEHGDQGWLDIPFETFHKLPEVEVPSEK